MATQRQPQPKASDRKVALATINNTLEQMLPAFKRAMPDGFEAARLIRVAMTEIQKKPELLQCSRLSLIVSLLRCAQLGLFPDSYLGHAYLVPFNDKDRGPEVQLIVGYKGIIQLTLRSGVIGGIFASVVYEGEEFDAELGDQPRLRHKPFLGGKDGDGKLRKRGQRLAAYAIAFFKDPNIKPMFKILAPEDVEARRQRSRARDSGPWKTDTDAMWAKSAVRALAPFLPLSAEDARAIAIDEAQEDSDRDPHEGLGDFIDLDELASMEIKAATDAKQAGLREKYETHPCCGEPKAGAHKSDCPNAGAQVEREPGSEG